MSRNIRRKASASASKARKRRGSDTSTSLDLSGESGYSGVDDISDDEDDEEDDVEAAEEEIFEREGLVSPAKPSRPLFYTGVNPGSADEEEEEEADDEGGAFNHDEYDDDEDDDDNDSPAHDSPLNDDGSGASWAGIVSEQDAEQGSHDDHFHEADYSSSTKLDRHVRFDLPDRVATDDDLSTDDDDYGNIYTDLFVEQTHLDPSFRREMERETDESSGSGSFWDFAADHAEFDTETVRNDDGEDDSSTETPRADPFEGLNATYLTSEYQPDPFAHLGDMPSPSDLDGYESDGETTEEDVPEPLPRRKTRRPSVSVEEITDSEVEPAVRSERGQPRVGRFRLDKCHKKPTVVLNPVTRKLMILTPHNRRQLDLSPEHFHDLPLFPFDEVNSPMFSNSASVMMSAVSMISANSLADFYGGQAVVEPEALFSGMNTVEDSEASIDSQTPFYNRPSNASDVEWDLDMSDFIAFGESSGDDADDDKNVEWNPSSTPARPTTASSDADILSHLTSHTVGAFRRNQVNQQLILSNQATQDSLAFSGPYNNTALRGLRSDRFDTAGAPLTPMRRRKTTSGDVTRSPLDKFAGKRKASGEASAGGHKKQRSISDVNGLHIG